MRIMKRSTIREIIFHQSPNEAKITSISSLSPQYTAYIYTRFSLYFDAPKYPHIGPHANTSQNTEKSESNKRTITSTHARHLILRESEIVGKNTSSCRLCRVT